MNRSSRIRVLVADDHPVFRQGLVETINRRPDMGSVGEAETGDSALQQIKKLKPDVAVIDMKMPGEGGMQVVREIGHDELPTRILFLSGYVEGGTVYEAIQEGARGYISKDRDAKAICDAIAAVAEGQMVLGPEVQGAIAEEIRVRRRGEANPLTHRERDILRLTADGHTAGEIAERLYLSPATVKTHLQRVYQKLGVSDRAAAVAEGLRGGMFE